MKFPRLPSLPSSSSYSSSRQHQQQLFTAAAATILLLSSAAAALTLYNHNKKKKQSNNRLTAAAAAAAAADAADAAPVIDAADDTPTITTPNTTNDEDDHKRDYANQALTLVPREVLQLSSLRILNLMNNNLTTLPPTFGYHLTNLTCLGLKSNQLTSLPDSLGDLSSLIELYLTNNQLTHLPPTIGNLTKLRKLQASFNCLQSLPESMANMTSLELFRAAVNPDLHTVPPALAEAPALTWLSLGGSKFCGRYSRNADGGAWWLVEGGEEEGGEGGEKKKGGGGVGVVGKGLLPPLVSREEVTLEEKLGDGASGEVFASQWQPSTATLASSTSFSSSFASRLTPLRKLKKSKKGGGNGGGVAVKVFRDDTSPDGRAIDELEVLCLVDHPNLTKVRALLIDTPTLTQEEQAPPARPIGVIMDLVTGQPLAAKPNHTSVLRCRWEADAKFPVAFVLRCARDVASALKHLHSKGICHGDVYGHNVVADAKGNATLLDYGASFVYASPASDGDGGDGGVRGSVSENGGGGGDEGGIDFERLEVRAYGLLLADMLQRISEKKKRSSYSFSSSASPLSPSTAKVMAAAKGVLEEVVAQCLLPSVKERPTFAMICQRFHD